MERITVSVTADTSDMGVEVLKNLQEWIARIGMSVTVEITVDLVLPGAEPNEPLSLMQAEVDKTLDSGPSLDNKLMDELDALLARIRDEGR